MVKKEFGKEFVLGFVKKSLNFPWLSVQAAPRGYMDITSSVQAEHSCKCIRFPSWL